MTKILGIDVGANFVVSFCLSELPTGISYPDYYKKNAKLSISKIRIDNKQEGSSIKLQEAIDLLRELKPEAIVMEPTGVWYSRLWWKLAEHLGIEVKWIGHGDLAHYRGAYGFKDKDDRTDAFCLALTYFDPVFNSSRRWLTWRTGAIARVNDRILELESLDSTTKILQQQIRQRLKYEFPEIAKRAINNSRTHDGFTPWVGWLAGIHTYKRICNEREKSISTELGIEIAQYTRDHAAAIVGNQIRETRLKSELAKSLLDPCFDLYRPILEKFGFSHKMQGTILAQIYPFERFLCDRQPWIDRHEDDRGWHKRNRSLAGFQISLGMGKRLIESGNSTSWIFAGSSFSRKKLYVWIINDVMSEGMSDSWLVKTIDERALSNPKLAMTVAELRERWRETKGSKRDQHMAGARSAMTLAYRVTRLLYDQLLREL
jgi:hypothetical protein